MRYTVHLFGLDADAFAKDLKSNSERVMSQVDEWLSESDFDPEDQKFGLNLVREICSGHLPELCDEDYFWALCWIGDAVLERVDLPELTEFRGLKIFEATGIWTLLQQASPPFPVSKSIEFPPGVGFLSHGRMEDAIRLLRGEPQPDIGEQKGLTLELQLEGETLEFSTKLSAEDREWVRNTREQLVDVLESLAEDRLDLLAIAVHI